ncbi:MAG: DUF2294 domain-containing protein [Cyanomargarita calcarea GSE-NOS-MK-12-04C]|jgi:uncharacterized protein YbcI|uniref:DUF2294 domain-containing protein n=1 Tax=Cyanomargarita calcarea GSE-NOS-MK-12-04C TaxID=2839659 RepID=A0A951QL63_9CYAN|nr:DUF2294 domain-containing protein [Cyanomargarita calcarea GSE-NOS-MK-12-04C]
MTASKPTRGQTERTLTQRIQNLYQDKLGQRPEKIICQFFDEKLAIVLEKSLTRCEELLLNTGREEFAGNLRSQLNAAIKPQLIELIQQVVGVNVTALLSDTDLKSGTSGMIFVLEDVPQVRDLESIPKIKKEKVTERDSELL